MTLKGFALLICVWLFPLVLAAAPPPTVSATSGSWSAETRAYARVSAGQEAVMSLPFAAQVLAVKVQPGVRVAAGDELVRVDAPELRQRLADWQQGRHQLELARQRLSVLTQAEREQAVTRHERLLGAQGVAQAQAGARRAWERLAADLDYLHTGAEPEALARRLDKQGIRALAQALGVLRAPFSGVVAGPAVVPGQQVAAGQALVELESLDQAYLEVGVASDALDAWQGGETVWHSTSGLVILVPVPAAPRYDPGTGLWLLRYSATSSALARRDGDWVRVRHQGTACPVLWVPSSAVVARNGKSWCLVKQGDDFKPVAVHVGSPRAGRVPVLDGLAAGAQVVSEGAYELLYRDIKSLIRFED